MSCATSFASDEPSALLQLEANPAGMACFDDRDMKVLATFKKDCDLNTRFAQTYKTQYEKCVAQTGCTQGFLDSRGFFWGSILTALAVGFIAGAQGGH